MKLSYTVATPDTQSASMMAYRGDLEKVFEELSKLGYFGVELMVRDVNQLNPQYLTQLALNHDLKIVGVSTGQLRAEDKLSLADLDEQKRLLAVGRMKETIDFAHQLDTHINIGSVRGFLLPDRREEGIEKATNSVKQLADYAKKFDRALVIEPQSRYTINWLNTVPETLRWFKTVGKDNVKLLFDLYHWMIEERSLAESLVASADLITHVQFSDSNRSIPGSGFYDFKHVVGLLDVIGFNGFVSIECHQHNNSYKVAKESIEFLNPIIRRYDKALVYSSN